MLFEVKAYRLPEGVVSLDVNERDAAEAERQTLAKGYKIISIQAKSALPTRFRGKSNFSAALFSEELLALLEAGLNLIESIEVLAFKTKDRESQRVLQQMNRQMREGLSFSRALESMPDDFPAIYIATIRSSEQTGDVARAVKRYLAYQEQINLVRNKVVSASIYPALLLGAGFLVVLFLLGYVVPRFSRVYEDLGQNLPLMSVMLMRWGHLVDEHGETIFFAVAGVAAAVLIVATRPAVWEKVEKTAWSLPMIGEKILLYQLARFTRTLSMLLGGGVPFVSALDMSQELLVQPALQRQMRRAATSVREGQNISNAFAQNGLATEVGVRLLIVGERSGNLAETMEKIASFYDGEISRWIDWFIRLFEPILLIVIGLVIGLIVILMYIPIFQLASSIQ